MVAAAAAEVVTPLEEVYKGPLIGMGGANALDMREQPRPASVPECTAELDEKGRIYATGRRKTATARVWIYPGAEPVRRQCRALPFELPHPPPSASPSGSST